MLNPPHETGITSVVDPLGGSYYVEKLTADLMDKAWELIAEVESLGGMTKAVETGLPKMRIEDPPPAATRSPPPSFSSSRQPLPLATSRSQHPQHRHPPSSRPPWCSVETVMRETRDFSRPNLSSIATLNRCKPLARAICFADRRSMPAALPPSLY